VAAPTNASCKLNMSEWTPPASGTPCWLNLPAKDVQRAKQFYSSVFDWQFQPQEHHSEHYPPELMAFFHAPDKTKSPGGAISKIENEAWLSKHKYTTEDRGNAFMYLFVSDLTEFMKKVEAAGGKKMSEIKAEGDHGLLQHFEDTEGNYLGMYMMKPKEDK